MGALGVDAAGGALVDLPAQAARPASGAARGRRRRLRAVRRRPELLRDGDARIFGRRARRRSDGWLLVVFSVPETERDKRHQLRSPLTRLGFGTVAPGVWVAPGHLADEAARCSTAGGWPLRRALPGPHSVRLVRDRLAGGGTCDDRHEYAEFLAAGRRRARAGNRPRAAPERRSPTTCGCSPTGGGCPTPTRACPWTCCPPTGTAPGGGPLRRARRGLRGPAHEHARPDPCLTSRDAAVVQPFSTGKPLLAHRHPVDEVADPPRQTTDQPAWRSPAPRPAPRRPTAGRPRCRPSPGSRCRPAAARRRRSRRPGTGSRQVDDVHGQAREVRRPGRPRRAARSAGWTAPARTAPPRPSPTMRPSASSAVCPARNTTVAVSDHRVREPARPRQLRRVHPLQVVRSSLHRPSVHVDPCPVSAVARHAEPDRVGHLVRPDQPADRLLRSSEPAGPPRRRRGRWWTRCSPRWRRSSGCRRSPGRPR